ncbi:MAG: Ig-like domain-containing protein [Paludibacteraceae bacterium]|nr:Ig-like domain-containing protein [Paludibacteraceae bacterium]
MKHLLSTLCAFFCASMMWAALVPTTFEPSDFTSKGTSGSGSQISTTKNEITLSTDKGYVMSSEVRVYAGGTITIGTATVISKIEVVASSDKLPNTTNVENKTANSSYTYTYPKGTWTPNDGKEITSVSLKCKSQVRFSKIIVYTGTEDIVVNSLSLDQTNLSLEEGKQQTLVATVDPIDTKLKWTSSNTEVATVDKTGLVKAITPGETDITVSAGDKSAVCHVTVTGSGEFVWYNILTADNMANLKNGDKVIIAAKSGAALMGYWKSGTNIDPITSGLQFNEDKSKCKEVVAAVYTLIKNGDKWNLKDANGQYLAISGLKNINAVASVSTNAQLTFTFASSSLKIQSNTSYGYLQYNSSASIFTTYTSYQGDISLYFRHDEYAGQLSYSPDNLTFAAKHLQQGEAKDTMELDIQFKNLDPDLGVIPSIKNVSSNTIEFRIVGNPTSITEPGKIKVAYYALEEGDYTADLHLEALALDGQEWDVIVPLSARILSEEIVLTPITIAEAYAGLAKEVGNWGNSTNDTGTKEYLLNDVTVTGHDGNFLFVQDATGSLCIYDNANRTHAKDVYFQNGDVLSGLRGTMKVMGNAVEMLPSEGYQPTKKAGTSVTPTLINAALDVTREGGNVNRYVLAQGVTFDAIKTLDSYYDEVGVTIGSDKVTAKNYFAKNLGAVDTQKEHYDIEGFVWASGKQMQLIPSAIRVSGSFIQHVSEVTLNRTSATMQVSEQLTLTATIAPADAANKDVIWSVKHDCVVVENGVVTALKAGQDTVVVTTVDGGLTAECAITITAGQGLHPGAVIYEKVTKAADLQADAQYIILCETAIVAAGEWQVNDAGTKGKYTATEAIIIGNQATAPNATVFTLGGSTDAWTLHDGTGYIRFTGSSENGYMLRDGSTSNTWQIAANGSSIISNDYTSRAIRFNNNALSSGGQIFTNYAAAQQTAIQLYRKTESVVPSVIEATGIVFTEHQVAMRVKGEKTLTAVVQPANASDSEKEILWSVKDSKEGLSVNSGQVVATAVGEYDVIATLAKHTSLADTCHIVVTDSVHVTGIELDRPTLSIVEASQGTLTATILPANADNQNIIWETSDASIATVADGVITAIRFGEVTITARSAEYNTIAATCAVTVTAMPGDRYHLMTADSVLHDGDFIVFYSNGHASAGLVDSKKYLSGVEATLVGADLVVSNSQPMKLTQNGSLWNLSIGSFAIGHQASDDNSVDFDVTGKTSTDFTISIGGSNYAVVKSTVGTNMPQFYCNAQGNFRLYNSTSMAPIQIYRKVASPDVPIAVESVELDYVALTLREGETDQLTATVYPLDAKIQDVVWGSVDETIATVEEGLVTALAQGQTQVWVRTVDGDFTDTCTVTVLAGLHQPDVTWNQVQDLSLLTEGTKVLVASVREGEDYVMGVYNYDVAKSNIPGAVAQFGEGRHAVTASASYAYTVSIVDGQYVFRDLDGMYLCDYSGKNLSTQEVIDNKAKWTVTMDEEFIFDMENKYYTGYHLYNNHNNDLFCCYNGLDQSNMSHIVLYSNNAPQWVEPIRIPELTITVNKDTITDLIDFGEVVYDDSWGTETNPYEAAQTLVFTAKWLTEDIAVSLSKGTAFVLYTESISKNGGSASIQFSVKNPGTYADTLYVQTGDIRRKIVLTAKTVTQEEAAPKISVSTNQIDLYLNLTEDGAQTDIKSFTFSANNIVKNVYCERSGNYNLPDRAGEEAIILVGDYEMSLADASFNLGAQNYENEEVLISVTAYTVGEYTCQLRLYTSKMDKTLADEKFVTVNIHVTEQPLPTSLLNVDVDVDVNKFLRNGHLLIRKDGKTYTILGQEVR